MVDGAGQAEIRGIDINKTARGFADEMNVFKKFVRSAKTSAREMRWYQKTSGFLDTTDTTGITKTWINPVAQGTLPAVVEQTWTRNTSYTKKFFVESPPLTLEDLKDNDINLLGTTMRDIVRAVQRKVDLRIFSVLNEAAAATPTVPNPTTVGTAVATADGWNDTVTGDPITDLLVAKRTMRQSGYNPEGAVVAMNSLEHQYLMNHLINVKGSSIPSFATEKVKSGVVMELLGLNVVVTENQTTDYVTVWIPSEAAEWRTFMPLQSVVTDDPGISKTIRCWEEGECLLTDPNAVFVITDTTV